MSRLFDPEAIKAQIDNLLADRERIDHAINALQAALRSVEGVDPQQREFSIRHNLKASGITLQDAVRGACLSMKDGITRQRVIGAIEKQHPVLKPKSPSVAAALINLTKGENPLLKLAIEGNGRRPAFYSTDADVTLRLSGDEIAVLTDSSPLKGTGGWQTFWGNLQRKFNKATGEITLTPENRARIFQYFHYCEGGWQTKISRVFRRELPHLFVADATKL